MDHTFTNDYHRPYRFPEAVIRVENAEQGVAADLEVITEIHSPERDELASKVTPAYLRHTLHNDIKKGADKLRSIPIRVEFDQPEHVLRAQFVKWSLGELSFPECVGNGQVANQTNPNTNEQSKVRCLGPSRCSLSKVGSPCMIDVRLNAIVEDTPVEIRSNSQNGFLAMLAGLEYSKAKASGVLSAAYMRLTTWEKSTRGSGYESFTTLRIDFEGADSMVSAVTQSMSEYGNKLLKEWEQRYALSAELLAQLPLPTTPKVVQVNYANSTNNTARTQASIEALFQLPLQVTPMAA